MKERALFHKNNTKIRILPFVTQQGITQQFKVFKISYEGVALNAAPSISKRTELLKNRPAHSIAKKVAFTQRHTWEIKERDQVIRSRVDLSTPVNTKHTRGQNGIIILRKEHVVIG